MPIQLSSMLMLGCTLSLFFLIPCGFTCPHGEVYGFALFGLDMPSALPCLARFCTPDMVGGVFILPSMSHLV
jgi:hypothetical protein